MVNTGTYFQLQIIGYNTDLYHNFTEALLSTHGLAVLAVLGSVSTGTTLIYALLGIYGKPSAQQVFKQRSELPSYV